MTAPQAPPATIGEAVRRLESQLEAAGVAECLADARLLVAHALSASPTWIFAHEPDPFPPRAWDALASLARRRVAREPLQHLLGAQEFWSLRLAVSREALIPRPETEVLVEAALEALRGVRAPRVADIGTGTGALALALASEIPSARLVAVDASPAALALARANARALGFEERIDFRQGSLAEPLAGERLDAIVANLPYVTRAEWEQLEPEVREHEPRLALVGGEDGLDLIRALVAAAPAVLAPGGWLGLEVGWTQAREVREILSAAGFTDLATRRDFADIERVVSGRVASRPENPGDPC